ncbi:competence protein CoiA [Pigmentiphaga litoralis]|uniref:competence protein CoiA n=1 Tax=Pigmentiphaga litoralis TaxID=516702 RepID=UPI003B431199
MSLTAIRNADGTKVEARNVRKAGGPYHCQGCGEVLTLKKGRVVVHHFAHRPPVTCGWGLGESAEHYDAKMAIFDALCTDPAVSDVRLEAPVGDIAVADVLALIRSQWVAIEVQRSELTAAQIARRTANYHAMGVSVLWVALPCPGLAHERYSPSVWEKWVHYAYFGRIYYWTHGQVVTPYHMDEHALYMEPRRWFDVGNLRYGGGYERRSRRWRTPLKGAPVVIGSHFQARRCAGRNTKTMAVPACTLYIDRQPAWWTAA